MPSEPFTEYKQGVYLVHISQPHFHAQHYLGWSKNIDARLMTHWQGPKKKASKLLWHVKGLGLTWELVRVWVDGTQHLERQLKIRHNGRKLCPLCNPNGPLKERRYVLPSEWDSRVPLTDLEIIDQLPF